jgi:hypothetical protein
VSTVRTDGELNSTATKAVQGGMFAFELLNNTSLSGISAMTNLHCVDGARPKFEVSYISCVCIYVCMHVCTYVSMYVYFLIYVCVYVCIYMNTCVYVLTYVCV